MDVRKFWLRRGQPQWCVCFSLILLSLAALPLPAQAARTTPTTEQLQRRIDAQDATIRELQRQLDALMRQIEPAQPPKAAAATAAETAQEQAETQPPAAPEAAQEQAEAKPEAPDGAPAAKPKQAPGTVTATEEEAERALERTLTATGALLLNYGQLEVEPAFSYTRREDTVPVSVINGVLTAVDEKISRNEYQPSLSARLGLPLDAQLETSLAYNAVQSERVTDAGLSRTSSSDVGAGIGDFTVGLAKTIVREKGWRPDLIGRVTWNTGSGQRRDNDVALGAGYQSVAGQVVALKRQDPLAFVASASYQKTFERNNVEPGDEVQFTLGAYLASSPDTSLQFTFAQSFADDTKVGGRTVKNSDQVSSTLNLGVSSIIAPNVLLQLTGGVGLTEDAPDYSLTLSVPIRFPVPVPRLDAPQ